MIDPRRLGEVVRCLRTARGLKREEVAVKAGVSVSTVDNLEQGRRLPRIETLERMAEAMGLSLVDMLREAARRLPAAA